MKAKELSVYIPIAKELVKFIMVLGTAAFFLFQYHLDNVMKTQVMSQGIERGNDSFNEYKIQAAEQNRAQNEALLRAVEQLSHRLDIQDQKLEKQNEKTDRMYSIIAKLN